MNQGVLSLFVLILLVTCSAIARGQSSESGSMRHDNHSGVPGMTHAPRGSWEEWVRHGERNVTPESYISPRSLDLGASTSPLSPAIGPGSGLLGLEVDRGPSRLRSNQELERGGTGSDKGGQEHDR